MRPLFLHFQNDNCTHDLHDQFMLGGELLVAPILHHGEKVKRKGLFGPVAYRFATRSVYLPAGNWVRAWHEDTSYKSVGKNFKIEVPYGRPAIFWQSYWTGGG